MNLDDYFEFEPEETVRIKGHRIWLHDVIQEAVFHELTLTELELRFPTLNREKILACLLYYERNKSRVDHYIAELERSANDARVRQRSELAGLIERMESLRVERERSQSAAS